MLTAAHTGTSSGLRRLTASWHRVIVQTVALMAVLGLLCGSGRGEVVAPAGGISGTLVKPVNLQLADAIAVPAAPATRPLWDWNGDNFFGPCRGDCALALYGGKEVTTSMTRIFFVRYPPKPIWDWRWNNSYIAAAAFSRRLVTFWDVLSLEPEFGVAQRFGGMHATEFWGALNIRWIAFPWNDYIKTTIGLADGLSVTTKIDRQEQTLTKYKVVGNRLVYPSSHVMNFFTPELTLAHPKYPDYELIFRFHHRSGVFGLINDVDAGAQFYTVGMRFRF